MKPVRAYGFCSGDFTRPPADRTPSGGYSWISEVEGYTAATAAALPKGVYGPCLLPESRHGHWLCRGFRRIESGADHGLFLSLFQLLDMQVEIGQPLLYLIAGFDRGVRVGGDNQFQAGQL